MKRIYGVTKIVRVLTVIGLFSLLANTQSKGTLLAPVPVSTEPEGGADFAVGSLDLSYSSGTFQVTAQPTGPEQSILAYNYGLPVGEGPDAGGFYGDFSLTATITSAGTLTAGSFTLNGDLGLGNNYETPLLMGTLITGANGVAFGSSSASDIAENGFTYFEFPFEVTGGDPTIVANFGGPGSTQADILLSAYFDPTQGDTAFTGNWGSGDFDNLESAGGSSDADIVVVPEPSSILLLLVGCVVCVGAYRATANKRLRSRG